MRGNSLFNFESSPLLVTGWGGGLWRNFPDATSYKVASVLRAPGIPLGAGGDLTAPIGQVALAVHGVVLTNSRVPR